jgi:hypothetical protein
MASGTRCMPVGRILRATALMELGKPPTTTNSAAQASS